MNEMVILTKDELTALLDERITKALRETITGRAASAASIGEIVDKHQAAELLQCSTATIDKLRRDGRLTVVNWGGRAARFERSQVLSILKPTNR